MNLYHVILRGMQGTLSSGIVYGKSYVVADNTQAAYNKVRDYLDKRDIGFFRDRALVSVELMASDDEYPECGVRLYL